MFLFFSAASLGQFRIFPRQEETVEFSVKVPVEMVASFSASRSNCFQLMGLDGGLATKLLAWEGALGVSKKKKSFSGISGNKNEFTQCFDWYTMKGHRGSLQVTVGKYLRYVPVYPSSNRVQRGDVEDSRAASCYCANHWQAGHDKCWQHDKCSQQLSRCSQPLVWYVIWKASSET